MSEVFLGSFLGLASALAAAWITRLAESRRTGRRVLAAITEEAHKNLARLENHGSVDHAFLGFFDRMAWSAAIAANQVGELAPKDTIQLVATMYHRLNVVEKWDEIRVQARLRTMSTGTPAKELDDIVHEARRLAKDSITSFLEGVA